jgi:para-aminobenzoate synthetase component 1
MTRSGAWNADIIHPAYALVGTACGATLVRDGAIAKSWADPLDAIAWMSRQSWHELHLDPSSRWHGHFSYELGRLFEDIQDRRERKSDEVLFRFGIDDSATGGRGSRGAAGSERATADAQPATLQGSAGASPSHLRIERSHTRDAYLRAARRAIDYIAAGDVFQVNLAQQFAVQSHESPASVFARMQLNTPGTFAAFQQFDDVAILSNSPELFFRIDGSSRRIINRPIKGTRPVGPGMYDELVRSPKDRAELAMIVDLQRNDLGRVCEIGSVRVTEPRVIEAHPTVLHGVATIEGILRSRATLVDVLRASFPCGSITGCPKIRAMQIIDELEPWPRDVYCGAIGWVGSDGSCEFNVAIRTMTYRNGTYTIPVGGGIVADSDPDAEYHETIVKSRAMFAALGIDADAALG